MMDSLMEIFKLSGNEIKIGSDTYIVACELTENDFVTERQLKKYDGADVVVKEEWHYAYLPKEVNDYSRYTSGPKLKFDGYWVNIQKKGMTPLAVIVIHETDYLTQVLNIL